jgi:trehalose/maltose transport system permease protein
VTVRRLLARGGFLLILGGFLFYAVFPFYYALISSLESGSGLFEPSVLPRSANIGNYAVVFGQQPFARSILNSFMVAVGTVFATLFLAALAAYALGRIRFRGRRGVLFTVLTVSMFPQVAVLSGMFELIRALGLYNRLPGLVLADLLLTLPFTVWMLTTFMRDVPKEIEEAAIIDGAGLWRLCTSVVLPLMRPVIATILIFNVVYVFNEFPFASILINDPDMVTVSLAVSRFQGQYTVDYGGMMAAATLVLLPQLIIYALFQRQVIAGMTVGAVKG